MTARSQRGGALLIGLVVLFLVGVSAGVVAQSLARRAHLLRRQAELAASEDLARAGRALARIRERDAAFMGPEEITLAGGRVVLARDASGRVVATAHPSIRGGAR